MKRKNNLYNNMLNLKNITLAYLEVTTNTKNKKKVALLKENKSIYIHKVFKVLKNKNYIVGPYNKFVIYEPKERLIASQGICDKIINHLVSRQILYPSLIPCLILENVASRSNLGTKTGLDLFFKYKNILKAKYNDFYILKCDIHKFFASIDHTRLKEKLLRKIKDKDALEILFKIIDSDETGLSIGSMTSQTFAIFYLNDLDHYIKEVLKINYYVRYQDDFLLLHPNKNYLEYCLLEISKFLEKEKLTLNSKTRIYKNTDNFIFLGITKNNLPAKYRIINRKLKQSNYLYNKNKLSLNSLSSSIICYTNNYTKLK